MNHRYRQSGLSLVEIMVALTISLLLVAGVIQIFASNKATYRMQEGIARLQENARFAMSHMTRDIRQAGYIGCTRNLDSVGTEIQMLMNSAILPASFSPESGLQGWEYLGTEPGNSFEIDDANAATEETNGNSASLRGWQPAGGGNALDSTPEVVPGSDILRVWHSGPASPSVTAINTTSPLTINVDDGSNINAGDIVLLSNCRTAYWLQVCRKSSATQLSMGSGGSCGVGNTTATPDTEIANATLSPLVAGTYFVGKRNGDNESPPSLYYAGLNSTSNDGGTGRAEELVEGVESMQVLYAEDTNNDGQPDGFYTADTVTNWENVTAVRIGLLMRTVDEIDTQEHGGTYDVNGTTLNLTDSDRRPRRVFTTTIMLRNRST